MCRGVVRARLLGFAAAIVAVALHDVGFAEAQATTRLHAAEPYAIVADQFVTSEGATTVAGDVAIAASQTLVGFPPGTITGETHLADAEAVEIAGFVAAADVDLEGEPCSSDRTGEDQGGLRLGAGVYCYIEPASLTGTLTLDALGDPSAVFVFQFRETYDVASGSRIVLANGARACNVFFRANRDITVGAGASVAGALVSEETIVVGDGASIDGRLLAPAGGVDLTNASVSVCEPAPVAATTTTAPVTTTTLSPAPSPSMPPPTADGTDADGIDADGTDDGDLLAVTGRSTLAVAMLAASALGIGHALLGTERLLEWNSRRWRPRHGLHPHPRLHRTAAFLLGWGDG